jgi:hypothetical protein
MVNINALLTPALQAYLMALCLTQQAALTQGQTVYAFKRALFRQLTPDQLPFLEHFLGRCVISVLIKDRIIDDEA